MKAVLVFSVMEVSLPYRKPRRFQRFPQSEGRCFSAKRCSVSMASDFFISEMFSDIPSIFADSPAWSVFRSISAFTIQPITAKPAASASAT